MSVHAGRLKVGALFSEGIVLLLVVFLFPLVILLIGAPIGLLIRAVIEIWRRF